MIRFQAEDFAKAFERTGWLKLPIGGKLVPVPYNTKRYEEIRVAYLEAYPAPVQKPVGVKVISPDSEEGQAMRLTSALGLEVYRDPDPEFARAQASWTAALGRRLAVGCIDVAIEASDGSGVLDEAGMLALYEKHMGDRQAISLVDKLNKAADLEVQNAADFSVTDSAAPGESGDQRDGGMKL